MVKQEVIVKKEPTDDVDCASKILFWGTLIWHNINCPNFISHKNYDMSYVKADKSTHKTKESDVWTINYFKIHAPVLLKIKLASVHNYAYSISIRT